MYLVVTILSLLAGASVVHNIYKPDMVTTQTDNARDSSQHSRSSPTVVLTGCAGRCCCTDIAADSCEANSTTTSNHRQ